MPGRMGASRCASSDSEGFSYRWSPVADFGGTFIDGERGRIHRDYNEWVKELDRVIQDELHASAR